MVSIDIGIGSAPLGVPGFAEHGIAAKPLGPYADRWRAFRASVGQGRAPDIVVLGGGVGGVELAMAMAFALREDGHSPQITVLERGQALTALGPKARAALMRRLAGFEITVIEGAETVEITTDQVTLADGRAIPAAFVVGVAGARAQGWLGETGLSLTEDGYISVGPDLRSSDPHVYAAGDCAHLSHAPRPKAGVFAVRQAPILHHNLRADLTGGVRKRFQPQSDYLKLISLGDRAALMEKWGVMLESPWLWRWKDRIDRAFMDKFHHLPAMPGPTVPPGAAQGVAEALAGAPPCGGCGAKVGGGVLAGVLAAQRAPQRPDVISGPGDDAAVLDMGAVRQVVTTDQLRAFTLDPGLQARITAAHALGDIWAMGAAPQAALAQVTLPRMVPQMQARWLAEIMESAGAVFAEAGAAIVGGHTSQGAELSIGFTVTGLCEAPITLTGAQAGDVLILTKPIGSGVLMAGEMRGLAEARWVAAAWEAMTQPQGKAAEILRGAHAMTDVTGFGLAGHLLALCEGSGVAARVDLSAVPFLAGARELAEKDVRSTLYPENHGLVAGRAEGLAGPLGDLLLDPQTAGGLLAAVEPGVAGQVLTDLAAAGYSAARIGVIEAGVPGLAITG